MTPAFSSPPPPDTPLPSSGPEQGEVPPTLPGTAGGAGLGLREGGGQDEHPWQVLGAGVNTHPSESCFQQLPTSGPERVIPAQLPRFLVADTGGYHAWASPSGSPGWDPHAASFRSGPPGPFPAHPVSQPRPGRFRVEPGGPLAHRGWLLPRPTASSPAPAHTPSSPGLPGGNPDLLADPPEGRLHLAQHRPGPYGTQVLPTDGHTCGQPAVP